MLNRPNQLWQPCLKPRWFRGFVIGLSVVLLIGLFNSTAIAQTSITQGRIAEILDGSQVYIQNAQARVNDVANRGQQVRTGNSRAQVSFNTGAVARLSTNSVLTIGQCANLQQGVLLVNGAVNGCTSSVTAGVRGTTYIMEVDEDGEERIQVLEGEVVVSQQANPEMQPEGTLEDSEMPAPVPSPETSAETSPGTPSEESLETPAEEMGDRPGFPGLPHRDEEGTTSDTLDTSDTSEGQIVLTAGQKISSRRGERLGSVERMSQDDFVRILTGVLFDGFAEELPGMSRIQDAFQRLFPNVPFPLGTPNVPIPRPRVPFF
jgi:hypothetical protein